MSALRTGYRGNPHNYAVNEDGCWIWQGALNNQGYPRLTIEGKNGRLAHRWHYERARGPIPEGLHLDHLCRTPRCVNPAHLEPVTQAENNRRSRSTKLTEAQVGEIARSDEPSATLARRFGVSRWAVIDVRIGRTWQDVYERELARPVVVREGPMTRGMLSVFGVLREADELELDASIIAVRAGLSKARNSAAIRDLRSSGLVVSRRSGWRTFVRLNQRPAA